MIQVCCYRGCGIVYGEKEPMEDNSITHGLCPLHHQVTIREIKKDIKNIRDEERLINSSVLKDRVLLREPFEAMVFQNPVLKT